MLRYDQGRQDGAHIDQWEDPKYEIYHMQDRSVPVTPGCTLYSPCQVRLHPRPATAGRGGKVRQGAEGPGEGDEQGGEVAGDDQGERQVAQQQETVRTSLEGELSLLSLRRTILTIAGNTRETERGGLEDTAGRGEDEDQQQGRV